MYAKFLFIGLGGSGGKTLRFLKQGLRRWQTERGPAFPFLVGRKNAEGVNFGTPERTFEMAGRSLVSWATDISVQRQLIAYTIGNFMQSSLNQPLGEILVDAGGDDKGLPMFSALGFSRVSLGTDYLEDYVVKRVARDANEHLADYHVLSDEAQGLQRDLATADPDAISRGIAKDYLNSFLREAGLSEYGPKENQIIDALRPDARLEERFVGNALKRAGIGSGGDKKHVRDWVRDITFAVKEGLNTYDARYRDALIESTCQWADVIESQILDTTEKHIASRGLHVARAVCELAAEHLARDVTRDLRDEAKLRRDWHSSWQRAPHTVLDTFDGKIEADDPSLEEAVREAVHLAKYVGEEHLAEWAADLCEQVAERVLKPLARALSDSCAIAANAKQATQAWPAWNSERPPKAFEPPISEFTVIDSADFPDHFSDRLEQTFPADAADGRRTRLRDTIVIGDFLKSEPGVSESDYNESRCLAVQGHWWPARGQPPRGKRPRRRPHPLDGYRMRAAPHTSASLRGVGGLIRSLCR